MYISIIAPIATEDLLTAENLILYESYPKGYEGAPLTSALINEYINRGHKVLAITTDAKMSDNDPPFIYSNELLTFIVIPSRSHTFRFNGSRLGRVVDFYHFERTRIVEILRSYKPDVVHAHWSYEFALAALEYTPNALITIHDNPWAVLKHTRSLLRFMRLLMAHYVFFKGKRFTTISPYIAQVLQRFISTKIAMIPNPLTTTPAYYNSSMSSSKVVVSIVNGWDNRKNGEKLLLAFKAVLDRHPTAVLWAIGTAFEPNGPAEEFCKLHKINHVICFGKLTHTEVLKKLIVSRLLLHTSLEESFGMVLIEAMSYGIPVVAGRYSGAVPWVVKEGGILVDVTRVDEITDAVDQLLSDQLLHEQISEKARINVSDRFSVSSVVDQYINLYQSDEKLNISSINN